ncbi:uncharacterized protein LTHEOB_8134 [Lasiodiplodia theobromae]|uniref:uncharacterized protein n=1 Tax=Lasiodiplodia theobromae TaxID=45133 RepID=UPI0015C408C6|nr:uncharacterized protein LTHEOB_8134 [Lasiodiplodia theobromae]KAF4541980.1 hypothetical protein LTHEOB_8134 [Lasiodiplodia theobromae]
MAAMASLDHVHPQSSGALQQLEEPHVPTSFSRLQKCRIVWTGIWISWNSNLGSSLPSGAVDAIRTDFSIHSATNLVCLNSLYMLGYTIGPPMFGPLSEHIGRRPVLIVTYISYLIFTMACALSNRFSLLLLFRFLAGLVAAAPNAVVGGLFADIYDNHEERGKVMAAFLLAGSLGSPIGPIISGLVEKLSWRWSFWIVLRRRLDASTRMENTPATELYGVYGMSPSTSGLAFLPVAGGCVAALGIFFWYEARYAKFKSTEALWTFDDEYRRLPLACIGGPGVVVALFWLGWTSVPSIHPAVPIMSGFCFGAGYLLIFMAMLNYLTDAY